MNAIKLLEEQHQDVDALVEALEKGRAPELKATRFAELADKLAAHATIEETIFYPAVMAKKTEELLLESVEEHLSIKRLLADMLALAVDDERFDAKLSVLKEQLDHHAHEEEEKELFPKVKKAFDADELEQMGDLMQVRFDELLAGEPRASIPGETAEAAPLPPTA
jgi:hemerythrin superfamily protein